MVPVHSLKDGLIPANLIPSLDRLTAVGEVAQDEARYEEEERERGRASGFSVRRSHQGGRNLQGIEYRHT